jgi:arylsulfatase
MRVDVFPVCLLLSLLFGGAAAATDPAKGDQPNFVVVFFDDLGFSDLGAFGSEIPTPRMDALARDGLIISQFYNHARCTPSRATLLTGVFPHQTGLASSVHRPGQPRAPGPYQGHLDENVLTIAEVLEGAGYRSYISGKWHVGEDRPHWPVDRGFHRHWGLISGASSFFEIIDEPRERIFAEDEARWSPPPEGFYMTREIGRRAVQFLEEHKRDHAENPFFLYVPFTAPHYPLHALSEDIEAVGQRYQTGWDVIAQQRAEKSATMLQRDHHPSQRPATSKDWKAHPDQPGMERRMAVYSAMIESADREVGRIVDALQAQGALDNTLIIIMSDNGASNEDVEAERNLGESGVPIGERGSYASYLEPWAWVSNTPFANFKKSVMEGGIRTPFIAHWPSGLRDAGRVEHNHWGTLTDIAPTLYALAGADYPAIARDRGAPALEGVDLSPLLIGDAVTYERPDYFWEHNGWAAVRAENWKAVRSPDGPWLLFDLVTDPTELNDLSAVEAERLSAMTNDWVAWATRVGVRERHVHH